MSSRPRSAGHHLLEPTLGALFTITSSSSHTFSSSLTVHSQRLNFRVLLMRPAARGSPASGSISPSARRPSIVEHTGLQLVHRGLTIQSTLAASRRTSPQQTPSSRVPVWWSLQAHARELEGHQSSRRTSVSRRLQPVSSSSAPTGNHGFVGRTAWSRCVPRAIHSSDRPSASPPVRLPSRRPQAARGRASATARPRPCPLLQPRARRAGRGSSGAEFRAARLCSSSTRTPPDGTTLPTR